MVTDDTDALIRKVIRRLIPFLILCFLLNFIDRTNITIAKNSMSDDIKGFLDYFDFGLAIFYIPYCLLEVPSNLIQERVGARRWISRIMISWGIVSTCFIFIEGKWSFYSLRVLLGIMEAGFFPGIILYLTYWIPKAYRARASALFFLSTAIASIIGNALGGYILYIAGALHLPGHAWQWLFVLEGIPSAILGVVVFFYLTDKPSDAKWLTADERKRLQAIMDDDRRSAAAVQAVSVGHLKASSSGHGVQDFLNAMISPMTWILSAIYAAMNWAYNPVQFYQPSIFKSVLHNSGVTVIKDDLVKNPTLTVTPTHVVDLYTGLLSAIPFTAAAVSMLFVARHSDKSDKRKPHLMISCGLLAVGLLIAAGAPYTAAGTAQTVVTVLGLSLAAMGWFGAFAVFWSLPAQLMTGVAVAAGLAIINSVGNLIGNFVGPWARGLFDKNFMAGPLLVSAGCGVVAVIIASFLRIPKSKAASGIAAETDETAAMSQH